MSTVVIYLCRRCLAAASTVRAWVALLSIMSIIPGRSLFPPSARSSQPACRAFRIGYVWYLLLARSRPGSPLEPVSSYVSTLFRRPPSRSGHAASTAAKGPLASLVGAVALAVRSGAFMVGFVNGRVQVCVLGLASTKISKTGISDISPRPQYYTTVLPVLHLGKKRCRRSGRPASALAKHDRALRHADVLT